MKYMSIVALLALCAGVPGLAQHKADGKGRLPAVFRNARYVHVESIQGRDLTSVNLDPEDRQAIANVEKELRGWKRYTLALRRSDAELVIVVRKGRLASLRGGGGISMGSGMPTSRRMPGQDPSQGPAQGPMDDSRGVSAGAGADIGLSVDLMRVYMVNPSGEPGALVWSNTMSEGLDGPRVPLFQKLKRDVERSYPLDSATGPNRP